MRKFLSCRAIALGAASIGQAATLNYSGSFNQYGYDVVSFAISASGVTDFDFIAGYGDATLSLFESSSGRHLITNDDLAGATSTILNPRITQNLAAGEYSLLAAYCCQGLSYVGTENAGVTTSTDGFNFGSFRVGGNATLSGLEADLQFSVGNEFSIFRPYTLQITADNLTLRNQVSESSTIALLAISLAAFALSRRRSALHEKQPHQSL